MNDVRRGRLKVYLGAAPGVGKTYRMLDEARSRAARGADVVVGFAECHGRPCTEAMLDGLETVPRARCAYRGGYFEEMDLGAVLVRRPEVAVVDEFAHSNVPGGGRNAKRWQDIDELLAAGIDVVTAVNVQHLASLKDVVEKITGVPQHETVPDDVVRRAQQIELIDMPPEGLRRRMAHGNIYAPEKVDAASPTTSGPETSPPCGSWRCCGSPTGPTRRCTPTAPSTRSAGCGRPGNGWWSPSPAAPRATR